MNAAGPAVECSLDAPLAVAESPANADSYLWWDVDVAYGRVVWVYRDTHQPPSIRARHLDLASGRLSPPQRVDDGAGGRVPPTRPHVAALDGRFFISWLQDYVDKARLVTVDGKLGPVVALPVHFFEYDVGARNGRVLLFGQMLDSRPGISHLSVAELDEQLRLVAGPTALVDAEDHLSFARAGTSQGAQWLGFDAPARGGSTRIGALRLDDARAKPVIVAVGHWPDDAILRPFFLAGIGLAGRGALLAWFDEASHAHGRLFVRRLGPDGSPIEPPRDLGLVDGNGFVLPATVARVGALNVAVIGPTGQVVAFDDEGLARGRSSLHLQDVWGYRALVVAGQAWLTWLSCKPQRGSAPRCDLFAAPLRCAAPARANVTPGGARSP